MVGSPGEWWSAASGSSAAPRLGADTSPAAQGCRLTPETLTEPQKCLAGRLVVLTGFSADDRKQLEKFIRAAGGESRSRPSGQTDFLVIGFVLSNNWRKVQEALNKYKKTCQILDLCTFVQKLQAGSI